MTLRVSFPPKTQAVDAPYHHFTSCPTHSCHQFGLAFVSDRRLLLRVRLDRRHRSRTPRWCRVTRRMSAGARPFDLHELAVSRDEPPRRRRLLARLRRRAYAALRAVSATRRTSTSASRREVRMSSRWVKTRRRARRPAASPRASLMMSSHRSAACPAERQPTRNRRTTLQLRDDASLRRRDQARLPSHVAAISLCSHRRRFGTRERL